MATRLSPSGLFLWAKPANACVGSSRLPATVLQFPHIHQISIAALSQVTWPPRPAVATATPHDRAFTAVSFRNDTLAVAKLDDNCAHAGLDKIRNRLQ